MKVNRVDEIGRLPDRDSKNRSDPNAKHRFRIARSLETLGNPNAEQQEDETSDCKAPASPRLADDVCYQVVVSPFDAQDVEDPRGSSGDESLQELLAKVRNAYRLNLRF
jgi:hypothetical protein